MATNDLTHYTDRCVICGAELAAGSKCLCAPCQKKARIAREAEPIMERILRNSKHRRITWRGSPEGEGS